MAHFGYLSSRSAHEILLLPDLCSFPLKSRMIRRSIKIRVFCVEVSDLCLRSSLTVHSDMAVDLAKAPAIHFCIRNKTVAALNTAD